MRPSCPLPGTAIPGADSAGAFPRPFRGTRPWHAPKNVLSCAFAYGKEYIHGVKSNPCQGVKVTVPKVRRDWWLTDSEIETVLQALPGMKSQKTADVYLLILASLCRPGEAAAIEAEDVITLNGERVWKVAEPKNGKDFLIPFRGLGGRKAPWPTRRGLGFFTFVISRVRAQV